MFFFFVYSVKTIETYSQDLSEGYTRGLSGEKLGLFTQNICSLKVKTYFKIWCCLKKVTMVINWKLKKKSDCIFDFPNLNHNWIMSLGLGQKLSDRSRFQKSQWYYIAPPSLMFPHVRLAWIAIRSFVFYTLSFLHNMIVFTNFW